MADYNHLQRWLTPQIERKGLTIERFARKVGVTRTSVYGYLTDHIRPTTQTMARICRFLGVPLEEGLRQYTPRAIGAPVGNTNRARSVTVRTR